MCVLAGMIDDEYCNVLLCIFYIFIIFGVCSCIGAQADSLKSFVEMSRFKKLVLEVRKRTCCVVHS